MVKVSIIIPALNEEKYLPRLLNSIKTQSFKDYEIIVADANSKDKTKKIAKQFGCKVVRGGLPPLGRNNGAKIAKGNLLLFIDADVILPFDFFEKTLGEFEKKNFGIATCAAYPYDGKFVDFFLVGWSNVFIRMFQSFFPIASGWCILVKSSIHRKISGFNEQIAFGEDVDYAKRASKFGRFSVLRQPHIYISARRFHKEGHVNVMRKYLTAFALVLFGHKIKGKLAEQPKLKHF